MGSDIIKHAIENKEKQNKLSKKDKEKKYDL